MCQIRPLFCLFSSFSQHDENIAKIGYINGRSVDGVLGIRTRDRRLVGTDKSTDLWRPINNQITFASHESYHIQAGWHTYATRGRSVSKRLEMSDFNVSQTFYCFYTPVPGRFFVYFGFFQTNIEIYILHFVFISHKCCIIISI